MIKIGAKFNAPLEIQVVLPRKFDDVIAVGERVAGRWDVCYFAKLGKTFGRDSVYFSFINFEKEFKLKNGIR